jgi:hypothetical protein
VNADEPKRLGKLVVVVTLGIRRISTVLDLVCPQEHRSIAVLFQKQASASPILVGIAADVAKRQTNVLEIRRRNLQPTVTRIIVLDKRSVHNQKSSEKLKKVQKIITCR